MRRLLMVAFALCLAGSVMAASTTNFLDTTGKGTAGPGQPNGDRMGGETIETATVVPGIPYMDTGNTCGAINDYDESCPYTGGTAPDVVYGWTPTQAYPAVDFDLCNSTYDTKLYIYAGAQGNLVGCSDDACAYQSIITNVPITAGVTYYVVVDGYGTSSCGDYELNIYEHVPCLVECPATAIPEGEPACGDNYVDAYNGGCNSTPHVFQSIAAQAAGCADICGKSGTYLFGTSNYRDTDWFDVVGLGGAVTYDCTAEFPLLIFIIYYQDCSAPGLTSATAGECAVASLSYTIAAGAHAWLWAGPSVYSGIPCEKTYWAHVCGIQGGVVPVENSTWGQIKNLYR